MRGDIALVMLFDYPGLFNATIEELDAIFPIGTVLAIREPTYAKEVMSNSPTPSHQGGVPIRYRRHGYERLVLSTSNVEDHFANSPHPSG